MLSAAERLRAELGPSEEPRKTATPGTRSGTGDGLFTRANGVDTLAVLDRLGIAHENSQRGEMATCPGCSEEGALVCKDGGIKCLHDRCAGAGPKNNPGFRTNVDIVACAQRREPSEAAKTICEWFNLEPPKPRPRRSDDHALEPPPGMFEDEAPPAKADTRTAVERYGVVSLQEMYLDILHQHDNKKLSCGFTTGIREIDIILGDLRRGNVALLAAMTSWGKSSFAVMTTFANLQTDARPLVISAEDARILYARRMLARDQQINALRLRGNELSKEDYKKLHAAAESASTAPIFLEVIGKPVEHIAKAIREIAKECGTGLVICDYIQRMKTDKNFSDRRNQVTYVGETLGDAIKNSNAAGLVMSQLKRIENREPGMDDIKESGDLENMAEHVLIGWKEVQKTGYGGDNKAPFRKLNVPKNKDGPIDSRWLNLGFHEDTASFTGRLWDGSDSPPSNYVPEPEQTGFDQYDDFEERYP